MTLLAKIVVYRRHWHRV